MRRSERIANAITHAYGQPNPALIDRLIEQNLTRSVDPLSSLSIATTARLVRTIDGRPIRSIVTGRRHVVTGSYASRKAGRAFPFESMNERAFFMHSEVTPRVVDFRAQPFRFEFALEGEKRIYIADAARLLDDGTFEVVEIKNDRRALRDPLYAAKLQLTCL